MYVSSPSYFTYNMYVAVVLFESTGESNSAIQVLESTGSLQVVLVLSKAINQQVSVMVVSTGITATGLLN